MNYNHRVMVSNRVSHAENLQQRFPNRVGCLFGLPDLNRSPRDVPFAIDNGRFSVWAKGHEWDKRAFLRLLESLKNRRLNPEWVVVPDVVTKPAETILWYKEWAPLIRSYNWPLALAVQDNMTVDQARSVSPDVVFVGGSKRWKWRTLPAWCREFPRVHVGRVNWERELWQAARLGAESSDGTGWFYRKQQKELERFLKRSSMKLQEHDYKGLIY